MKAITLTQPWATLMAIGAKHYETRSWKTDYRGQIAIHAAKGFPDDCMDLCSEEPFKSVLASVGIMGPDDLPRGVILATGQLVGCFLCQEGAALPFYDGFEREFGDFTTGRYAILIEHIDRLEVPLPCRGQLSLWHIPNEVFIQLGVARRAE